MEELRKELNTEEKLEPFGQLPLLEAAKPVHPLHCQACAQLYFVDDHTYRKALSGPVREGAESGFICAWCESQGSERYAH